MRKKGRAAARTHGYHRWRPGERESRRFKSRSSDWNTWATDAAAMTPMQTIATLLKTTASEAGALRAICWAVFARWSGFGADIVVLVG